MTTTLGTVVRSRREAAFLSQRELAHRINVSNGTISRIESGDGLHPDPQTLRAIADILHIDYYYLLTLNGQIDDSPDIRMIRRGMAKLSPADRKKLMRVLNAVFDDLFTVEKSGGDMPGLQ